MKTKQILDLFRFIYTSSVSTHTNHISYLSRQKLNKKVLESVVPKRLNLRVDGKLTILRNFWQKHWPQKIDNQCVDNQKKAKNIDVTEPTKLSSAV